MFLYGGTASDGDRPSLGLLLHRWAWGADITRVRCLERLHGDEDVAGNFDPGNSMLRVRGDSPTGLVVRSEPFRNTREVHVSAKVQPGQYVIVPMTYDPSTGAKNASAARTAAAPSVGRHGAPEFWLSVFGKSPLHPIKLFSDGEVEWADRYRMHSDWAAERERDCDVVCDTGTIGWVNSYRPNPCCDLRTTSSSAAPRRGSGSSSASARSRRKRCGSCAAPPAACSWPWWRPEFEG